MTRRDDERHEQAKTIISAKPFVWRDASAIPARDFLFGVHYIREFVSGTAAPGGTGKSFLAQGEALSMASGQAFLGISCHDYGAGLNVWYWNLEDPHVEIERRFVAAALHHGIDTKQLEGRLYVNSGRDTPLVIASKVKDQVSIAAPVVEGLIDELRAKKIDVIIIDPFISSHAVPENDNAAIDAVVKSWGRIASQARCSVELVHHTKKMGGEAMTEESFRGAKSLVDGLRSGRVLHRMSEQDAVNLGIVDERRRYFYTMAEKQSLAPPAADRTWFRLSSLELINGDNVGVVEPWHPPNAFDGVTVSDLEAVQKLFRAGNYRESDQSTEWGGYAVADVLSIDVGPGLKAKERSPAQSAARAKVKQILRTWMANGQVATEERPDAKRNMRLFFVVPDGID